MNKTGFVDIHAHAQREAGTPRCGLKTWASADELIKRYDELGVEQGVLLPITGPEFYEPQSNQDILEICEKHPDRFLPFCNIHPRAVKNAPDADFRELLDYYIKRGCKGVGEITANLPFDDDLVQNLLAQIEEAGLPVTIHVGHRIGGDYGLVDQPELPLLEATLKRLPALRILAHAPGFWSCMGKLSSPEEHGRYQKEPFSEEGRVPVLMRRYENLYGDLSAGSGYNALACNPDYACTFLTEFQDRLLFGIDITAADTPAPLAGFLMNLRDTGSISETVFSKVTRENAQQLLGLAG